MFNFNKSDINALSLIIVPLILSALGAWINPAIIGPASIGSCIFYIYADRKQRKQAGVNSPSFWWWLLSPVYLWKRDTLDSRAKHPLFLLWCVSVVVMVLISLAADAKESNQLVKTRTCELVTEIMHDNRIQGSCVKTMELNRVEGTEFYRGTVLITNGNEVPVTTNMQKDGNIYVRITDTSTLR
ncbi:MULTISPECIES: hypothetical protein [Edwardsiella]|uniref:Cytochrome c-type biogenesis protein DsbD, protein-disulfide reductase n=3 Tax=Edwardsiella TaxID=635 RepID=A0A076LQ24_9GAMM|nr:MULTISPECIES: hypothetical protein [Edwardsiella]ADM42874.1 hypothetical membrane protein [Edwardsiella tarda FL6-60]AKM46816.1 membrane protein [Edwardsiella sp. EA181011]AGH75057.1 membrane protein [Edwardsiella piscicida C07-087]AIJ07729.1 Cytochrome c-type biogenesis protein DsbD, protein-disulfide reductase [Edwardsiella anguillarum ET080813]AKR78878.1 hypothetical protein AAZ33_16030 [Edwardsiella sp. LADL05-105]